MEPKFDYDFIFSDIKGNDYLEIHWKNISAKEFTRKINRLKWKYNVSEAIILLKWFK
jgi:hypothetical protein|nr:MAG TPA: hypothetical protein [Caudoviricetes sp.]